MRIVIAILFFAIALAPESTPLKFDLGSAAWAALAAPTGAILSDCLDGDDDYRNFHSTRSFAAIEWPPCSLTVVQERQLSDSLRIDALDAPLVRFHAVLRI